MINVPELNLPHYNILISAGGLAVPNFELYFGHSSLRALHNWLILNLQFHGRLIEADKVNPNSTSRYFITGTGKKGII